MFFIKLITLFHPIQLVFLSFNGYYLIHVTQASNIEYVFGDVRQSKNDSKEKTEKNLKFGNVIGKTIT